MTWVIGATTYFGYAVLVSDIRVTFRRGAVRESRDALQKAFQVGDFVVAGFAGSVPLGFALLRDLHLFLAKEPDEGDVCWQLGWVVENWRPRAQAIYQRAPASWRAGEAEILMVGAEADDQAWDGSHPMLSVLRGPGFEPDLVTDCHAFRHIGSGSGVEEYERSLAGCFAEENFGLLQAEVMNPGGFGRLVAGTLGRSAHNHPDPKVSRHMHVFIVRLGKVEVLVNNMDRHGPDGAVEELRMPPVATTPEQLSRLLESESLETALATTATEW